MRHAVIVIATLAVLFSSCSHPGGLSPAVSSGLRAAPVWELISLDPEWTEPTEPYADDAPREHGAVVLGRTMISDPAVREDLVAQLEQAVAAPGDGQLACFAPRHMIRLQHAGQSLDLLICFQCRKAYAVINGQRQRFFSLSPAPEAAINQILTDQGIAIAR